MIFDICFFGYPTSLKPEARRKKDWLIIVGRDATENDALLRKHVKGREEGREDGIEEGREASSKEIAGNLLAEGSTPEFVHKITGLDLKTIEALNK